MRQCDTLKDHWNGDLPLPVAFWGNNVLLELALYLFWDFVGAPFALDLARANDMTGFFQMNRG